MFGIPVRLFFRMGISFLFVFGRMGDVMFGDGLFCVVEWAVWVFVNEY